MYLHGEFINRKGQRIALHIVTGGDRTKEVCIGDESSGVWFAVNAIELESDVSDTFAHILSQRASITLLTREYMPELFCSSCMDAVVNIMRDGHCVFAGYVEPQAYSQSYAETLDEITLTCIDALAALQYSKYRNIGSLGVLYSAIKTEAKTRTFHDIITEALSGVTSGLSISDGCDVKFYHDMSKAIDDSAANKRNIFRNLSISELVFLGSEEDDVWQQDAVVEELLRYLNLRIVQIGDRFYIFDWATVRASGDIMWCELVGDTSSMKRKATLTFSLENVEGTDTQISIGEVYNRFELTCEVKKIESIVESPLDGDLTTSLYDNHQLYMREYFTEGEGDSAYSAFNDIVHGRTTTYDAAYIRDWHMQVMKNAGWRFPINGGSQTMEGVYSTPAVNQHNVPNAMRTMMAASVISWGSVDKKPDQSDNSLTANVDMKNWLVVSVNGNKYPNSADTTQPYPGESEIKAAIPVAEYTGSVTGGVFSPSDDETTNYIVLSGSVVLNPIMIQTEGFAALKSDTSWGDKYKYETVPSRNNDDGRYYTRQFFRAYTPNGTAYWDNNISDGLMPFTNDGPEEYEFKYSAIGDGTDRVSKVAVLACMLIIGDKCVVEKGTQGRTSDYQWAKYKELSECASEDEYYQQSFTIGFDPKIGDKLVGSEFDLQNNIEYTMGIDAKGTAIPVKKADKVSGRVRFIILGPVNTVWDEVTRRHATFFRHTAWSTNSVPLLANIASIMLGDFCVKVYSDNAKVNNGVDGDLVYMTDTKERYTNTKDDITFRITSALTSEECRSLGVANTPAMSTPQLPDGSGLVSIHDYATGETSKPEKQYVDSCWREWHAPRVVMEQSVADVDGNADFFRHYRHEAMSKEFFVQSMSRDLSEGTARLTIKEVY